MLRLLNVFVLFSKKKKNVQTFPCVKDNAFGGRKHMKRGVALLRKSVMESQHFQDIHRDKMHKKHLPDNRKGAGMRCYCKTEAK